MNQQIPIVLTVAQMAEKHPAFSEASLRWLIFKANPQTNSAGTQVSGNGLYEHGAIVRVGRRVLFNERRFFDWIYAQQKAEAS